MLKYGRGLNKTIALSDHRIGIVIESRAHGTKVAIVAACDYPMVAQYRWNLLKAPHTFYVYTRLRLAGGKNTTLYLHRFIMQPVEGKEIDHIDGSGLNNSRSNLRECSSAENKCNRSSLANRTSKYKGVSYYTPRGVWQAEVKFKKQRRHLGHFRSELDAARAYNAAAVEMQGAFAKLNRST